MPSKVQICNRALSTYVGDARIVSLSEDTAQAKECALHYEDTLKSLLEMHWWNFSTGRQIMASEVNDRTDEWAYKYAAPADALSIRWVNSAPTARLLRAQGLSPDVEREFTGSHIYCDVAQATCEFTSKSDDPTVYPQFFADALSAMLATQICLPLVQDRVRLENAVRAAETLFDKAVSLDSRNTPPVVAGAPDWFRSRGIS